MLSFHKDLDSTQFLRQLQDGLQPLCTDSDSLLLAVSGGADSMALLDGCLKLRQSDRCPSRIAVAHLNHGLRGLEGVRDLEFVESQAAAYGVEFFSKDLTGVPLISAGESLEEAARRHRYEFLLKTASLRRFTCLVTAHHLDDQAETVLHNIMRGTGLRGLSGMSSVRLPALKVRLIRPLLAVSREVIRGYLAEYGIRFVEDSSNTSGDFTRNRIRHELMPVLERDFNVQVVEHLASLAEQVRESLAYLDVSADRFLTRCVIQKQPHAVRLHRQEFDSEPSFLTRHALIRLWDQIGWPRQQMTTRHWHELDTLLRGSQAASMDLPGGIRAEVDGRIGRFLCDSSHLTD